MRASKPMLFTNYGEGVRISLLISEDSVKAARQLCDKYKAQDLDVEIKQHRERRSLTANAYAWQLMSKIGKAISPPIPNESVYEMMLRRYAPVTIVSVLNGVNLAEYVPHAEKHSEMGDMTEWRVYKGSSEYDSKEMSVFIDGIKSEAEALGIEVMTPAELEVLYEAQVNKGV